MPTAHRILVVDDQPSVRRLLTELFRTDGMDVVTAPDGAQAIEVARASRPSLAVVDMRMPVLDGVGAIVGLKELHPDLPILLMTAVGDTERVAEAIRLGAFQAITKPFDVFKLRELVQGALARLEGTGE